MVKRSPPLTRRGWGWSSCCIIFMNNFWSKLNKPILALAPMEGVTDQAFRTICRNQGADLAYTEFVSSDALAHNSKKALGKLAFKDTERPIVCQIFGKDPQAFAQAAETVEKLGFDGIDLNFGCPARKVVSHGSGVALLRDPKFASQLIEAALERIHIPLSIKVRASIRRERKSIDPNNNDCATALDLVEAIEGLPVAALMVHGRSFEGGFQGPVDLEMIKQVKQRFNGPVLANGGVLTPEDAQRMLEATSADGVGIARGALGKPWLFNQIKEYLKTGRYAEPTWDQKRAVILEHARLALEHKGGHGLIELRKHLAWYVRGRPNAAEFRRRLVTIKAIEEIERILDEFGAAE